MTLHMVYDCSSETRTEHAVSDWTGRLHPVDPDNCPGEWTGNLDVAVSGTAKGSDYRIDANGSEKYGFGLRVRKDGYEIHQGFCNTQFGTETRSDGSTDHGSITDNASPGS